MVVTGHTDWDTHTPQTHLHNQGPGHRALRRATCPGRAERGGGEGGGDGTAVVVGVGGGEVESLRGCRPNQDDCQDTSSHHHYHCHHQHPQCRPPSTTAAGHVEPWIELWPRPSPPQHSSRPQLAVGTFGATDAVPSGDGAEGGGGGEGEGGGEMPRGVLRGRHCLAGTTLPPGQDTDIETSRATRWQSPREGEGGCCGTQPHSYQGTCRLRKGVGKC